MTDRQTDRQTNRKTDRHKDRKFKVSNMPTIIVMYLVDFFIMGDCELVFRILPAVFL